MPLLLNLTVPGTGLLCLRQWRLGLTTAAGFVVSAELALCGWLVSPAGIPRWLTWLGTAGAAVSWLAAQAAFSRARIAQDPKPEITDNGAQTVSYAQDRVP